MGLEGPATEENVLSPRGFNGGPAGLVVGDLGSSVGQAFHRVNRAVQL